MSFLKRIDDYMESDEPHHRLFQGIVISLIFFGFVSLVCCLALGAFELGALVFDRLGKLGLIAYLLSFVSIGLGIVATLSPIKGGSTTNHE